MNRVRRASRAFLSGALLAAVALFGCGSPLPPVGTLQVEVADSKRTPQIRAHSSYSNMALNLSYAGPHPWLAWGVEHWTQGKPAPVRDWQRYQFDHPRKLLSFSIQDENFQGKPP